MKKKVTFSLDKECTSIVKLIYERDNGSSTLSSIFEDVISRYHDKFADKNISTINHGKRTRRFTVYLDEDVNIKLTMLRIKHNLSTKKIINNSLKIIYTNLYPFLCD